MTWLTNDGNITLAMEDLATFNFENIRLGLVYGCQLGLTSLMLITVLLLTQSGKRGSPIYILNVSALLLDLLRGSMMVAWSTSMYNHPYVYFASDLSRISATDMATSVAADVFKTLELTTILTSLIFQVRVILSTTTVGRRALVVGTAAIVALVTLAVQLATAAVNARNTTHKLGSDAYTQPDTYAWYTLQWKLADATAILQLVSASFFLGVFAAKLGLAIRQRRRLGHRAFGPMQMVFVGSMQSMLIPVIFTAAQWNQLVDLGSLSITVLAIQLPLTALWASTTLEGRIARTDGEPVLRRAVPTRSTVGRAPLGKQCSKSSVSSASSSGDTTTAAATVSSYPAKIGFGFPVDSYRLGELSSAATTTCRSLDVEVKMYERDMV